MTVNSILIYTPRNEGINLLSKNLSDKYIVIQNPYCSECLDVFARNYAKNKPPIIIMINNIGNNYLKVKYKHFFKTKFPESKIYFCSSQFFNKYSRSPFLIEIKKGKIIFEDYKNIFIRRNKEIILNPKLLNYFN